MKNHNDQQIKNHYAYRLKVIRHERGYTQEELAERADLHPTYIAGIESGRLCIHFSRKGWNGNIRKAQHLFI